MVGIIARLFKEKVLVQSVTYHSIVMVLEIIHWKVIVLLDVTFHVEE